MITSDAEVKKRMAAANVDKTFLNNAGMSGMIFNENHPYFSVPKEHKKLALNNFNLPIPKTDGGRT